MRQKRERARLKKEETGTALTQQNWERFSVLLKISRGSHRNPSVSRVPGQLGFVGHTEQQLGREPAGSTAQLSGMPGPAPGTRRKQNQQQAPHGCSPERSSCTYGLTQGWAGEKGEEMSSWQLPVRCWILIGV